MKIGDYVRTKRGQIHKITDLKGYYENGELIEDRQYVHIDNHFSGWDLRQFKELIIKSSPNIIDLIEVGDYVNGYLIEKIYEVFETSPNKLKEAHILYAGENFISQLYDTEIKSIVTKEQFEAMEYRVGE